MHHSDTLDADIARAAELIAAAAGTHSDAADAAAADPHHDLRVEVFTGAGMSADSGLDTFRDAGTGLWENVDPTALASIDAWARDPEPMWAWYLWRARKSLDAEPNAGHLAVADWQAEGPGQGHVTTQNIDDLHERAGAHDVAHLHGSLFDFRCTICARPYRGIHEGDIPVEPVERATPPTCPCCGNLVRPGVVWFGEALPHDEWDAAERWARRADVMIVVGTSGVVYPAAGLPVLAAQSGAVIIEVTPQPTELTGLAAVSLSTTAAHGLPLLYDAVLGAVG